MRQQANFLFTSTQYLTCLIHYIRACATVRAHVTQCVRVSLRQGCVRELQKTCIKPGPDTNRYVCDQQELCCGGNMQHACVAHILLHASKTKIDDIHSHHTKCWIFEFYSRFSWLITTSPNRRQWLPRSLIYWIMRHHSPLNRYTSLFLRYIYGSTLQPGVKMQKKATQCRAYTVWRGHQKYFIG